MGIRAHDWRRGARRTCNLGRGRVRAASPVSELPPSWPSFRPTSYPSARPSAPTPFQRCNPTSELNAIRRRWTRDQPVGPILAPGGPLDDGKRRLPAYLLFWPLLSIKHGGRQRACLVESIPPLIPSCTARPIWDRPAKKQHESKLEKQYLLRACSSRLIPASRSPYIA